MKNFFLALLCTCACNILFAQTDSTKANPAATGTSKIIDTAAMARVYVIRSTGHIGSAVNLRVSIDDSLACKVRNNRYAVFYVQPGTHLFNATSWDKAEDKKLALKVPVEAGKTYYTSIQIKQRFFGIEIFMEEITYNTAAPLLAKYKQDECD